MRVLRWLLGFVVFLLVLTVGVGVAARFADGAVGPVAGGAFRSGEPVPVQPDDWSFATDIEEIELQLLEPARTRVTWIVVHEGQPYIPCGFLDVPLWKQWPHEAERDGRAILRIDGRLYERQAVRVTDPGLHAELGRLAAAKYGFGDGEPPSPDQVWYFRMEPRPAS
ncbi:MAG: hypothetical protein ABFS46_11685 [Myxococcota bacterium]